MTEKKEYFEAKMGQIRTFLEDFRDFSVEIDEIKEVEKQLFEPPYVAEEIQGAILDIIFKVGSFIEEMEIAIAEDA